MQNISHPDEIFTVEQFNSYCRDNKIPMCIEAVTGEFQGTVPHYKSDMWHVMENDEIQMPYVAGATYAVVHATDRLKDRWQKVKAFTS